MDPSSGADLGLELCVAALPALFAALFATGAAVLAAVPDSRKEALRSTLQGGALAALDRYLADPTRVEARWLVVRVLGLAGSAVLMDRALAPHLGGPWQAAALLGVLVAYAVPASVGVLLARSVAERGLSAALRILRPFELLVAPIAAPLGWLGDAVAPLLERPRPPSATLAETEVEIVVKQGEAEGSLGAEPAEMIRNVLDFGEVRAGDLMVPRTNVTALEASLPMEGVLRIVGEETHSRYPVYREQIDNVVGILHVKDLLTHAATTDLRSLRVVDLMRTPVVFVPETQSASSLLRDMRSGRRHHMAIVIDEFGGMSGVVTLEDVVEQIVGDIRDEHDTGEPPISDLGGGRLLVDAGIAISDLSRYLGIELPDDGEYSSLGGFIVERHGRVPPVGTTLSDLGLDFVVREADERRVARVEIIRQSLTPGPAGGPDSLVPQTPGRPQT